MDLTLSDNNPRNTLFLNAEGSPLYHVDTPFKLFRTGTTTIQKIAGPTSAQMATVELHQWSQDVVVVWGRDVAPYRTSNVFSTSEIFNAADSKSYKWKIDWGTLSLVPNDGSDTPVAFFDYGSLGILSTARPPTLSVAPVGLPILDEIIATFIYMEQKRRRRRRNRNSAI